jgi:hypothetical protein
MFSSHYGHRIYFKLTHVYVLVQSPCAAPEVQWQNGAAQKRKSAKWYILEERECDTAGKWNNALVRLTNS